MPQGDFGKAMPQNPFQYTYVFDQANAGFGLGFGTMYFLKFLDLGDQFMIGVDVTWINFTYQSASYKFRRTYSDNQTTFNASGDFKMDMLFVNLDAGPSFSYSPNEKLALDIAFKLSPTAYMSWGKYTLTPTADSEQLGNTGSFGMRYTPSFYVRYSTLMLGVEYAMGDIDVNYSTSGPIELTESKVTSNYDQLRIILGLKF